MTKEAKTESKKNVKKEIVGGKRRKMDVKKIEMNENGFKKNQKWI